jgi:hypothetical protein
VKALSLRQPWLYAILDCGKRIENRVAWKGCNYRGPILLHAAKGCMRAEYEEVVQRIGDVVGGFYEVPAFEKMLRGGIVGRARIDGVIRNATDFAAYESNVVDAHAQRFWWFGGFALVLADVEPLPFVPWTGALGIFNVPDDYAMGLVSP